MSAGWLLVLGSDAGSEAPIDATLAALRELGQVQALTPSRRSRDDDGTGRWFTNRLVRLDSALARDELRDRLREVERQVGRSDAGGEVLIDIDLLAGGDANAWHLDPHAAGKGEHQRPHVVAHLHEACIQLP